MNDALPTRGSKASSRQAAYRTKVAVTVRSLVSVTLQRDAPVIASQPDQLPNCAVSSPLGRPCRTLAEGNVTLQIEPGPPDARQLIGLPAEDPTTVACDPDGASTTTVSVNSGFPYTIISP